MQDAGTDVDQQTLILVVDDDPDLCALICSFLTGHGYLATAAANAAQMWQQIERTRPSLVILDVMMPGEDGLSAARSLAARGGPPVIMLSALGSDTDRIIGLEVGADDYLPKPCNPRELLARVRAVLRRQQRAGEAGAEQENRWYEFDGWRMNFARRELRDPADTFINLSDGEFALLRLFVEQPRRVLSRDQLLDQTRGHAAEVYDRAIDSQISRLRRKLNERSAAELIRTVRNEGYMLQARVVRR